MCGFKHMFLFFEKYKFIDCRRDLNFQEQYINWVIHKRINGLIRMFSINICFFIEAVTNEFDG
jgi:hypothetical protein